MEFIEDAINYCSPFCSDARNDVFVRGVHHRHSKQATSLEHSQCWKENCQLKKSPNKPVRRSFIRSHINSVYDLCLCLCSLPLIRSQIFSLVRGSSGILGLGDAWEH